MSQASAVSEATSEGVKKPSLNPGPYGFKNKAVDHETYPLVFEMVPLRNLFIDTYAEAPEFLSKGMTGGQKLVGYQRMKLQNAQKIAGFKYNKDGTPTPINGRKGYDGGFRWELFTPLIASKRSATRYAVIDGGSRLTAIHLMGAPGDTLIPILRYRNPLTYQQEAQLFVNLNEQRLGLTAVDTFLAKVEYGDRDAVNIDRILKTITGTTIGNDKGQFTAVQAITDLWARHRQTTDEGSSLKKTMEALVLSGWINQPKGKVGAIIAGIGLLFDTQVRNTTGTTSYKWEPRTTKGGQPIDMNRLIEKMETFRGHSKYRTEAERAYADAGVRETNSRSRAKRVSLVLAEAYNKGLKGQSARIDTTPFIIEDDDDEGTDD